MIESNFEYLKDQLKFTGFGEGLEAELKSKIESKVPEFKLGVTAQYNEDQVDAILSFSKSKTSDMYFFNSYDLQVQKPDGKENTQHFYINPGGSFTMREGYNLMEGRSVNKDFSRPIEKDGAAVLDEKGKPAYERKNTWTQMDFNKTDEHGNHKIDYFSKGYGFDLEAALNKLPIKEMSNPDHKENILESMKKGNRQAVTFNENGGEKRYVEANAKFKTINVFDSASGKIMRPVNAIKQENVPEKTQSANQSRNRKSNANEDQNATDAPPKQNRRKGRKVA